MNKMKAGWIGFLNPEDDLWQAFTLLAKLGYQGVEAPDRLLEGCVADNVKRMHDLGLQALCVSADIVALRAGDYGPIIEKAHALQTDRVSCWPAR